MLERKRKNGRTAEIIQGPDGSWVVRILKAVRSWHGRTQQIGRFYSRRKAEEMAEKILR